jgi:hypothetical protein
MLFNRGRCAVRDANEGQRVTVAITPARIERRQSRATEHRTVSFGRRSASADVRGAADRLHPDTAMRFGGGTRCPVIN